MNSKVERYSLLSPFPIEEKIRLSIIACSFFSPMENAKICKILDKPIHEGRIKPFDGLDFINYLEKSGKLASSQRSVFRIGELLKDLAAAHILTDMGPGRGVIMGSYYYFTKELTEKQKSGVCWLAPAFGGEFIYSIFGSFALHISGVSSCGDIVAGTGIAINDHWILTCAHVLDDMKLDGTQYFSGKSHKVEEYIAHPDIDIGLIRVAEKLSRVPGLSFTTPVAGSNLYTIGYPRVPMAAEVMPTMHKGEVTVPMLKTLLGKNLFLYSAIARPGNSGGPIIGRDGTILGIVTEELYEQSTSSGVPFYAGVPTSEIVRAINDLRSGIEFPIEDYS